MCMLDAVLARVDGAPVLHGLAIDKQGMLILTRVKTNRCFLGGFPKAFVTA